MWLYIAYENMSVVYSPGITKRVAWNASGGATTAAVPSSGGRPPRTISTAIRYSRNAPMNACIKASTRNSTEDEAPGQNRSNRVSIGDSRSQAHGYCTRYSYV